VTATSLCAFCGMQRPEPDGLCLHHATIAEQGWAVINRVMCDFFHRGIAPARLSAADRDDDLAPRGAAA
jgi:hypothetical protein